MIRKEDIQDIYSLSPMQSGMLLNHALDPESSVYLEQFDFKISGEVDPQCMQDALIRVSESHDILRTVFSYKKTDQPRQIVLKSWHPPFSFKDFRQERSAEEAVEAFKEADRIRGFNLSRDVLIRGALLRVGNKAWRFILTFHHILMDGWSLAPFFEELFSHYEAAFNHQKLPSVRAKHQYREYIQWLQNQKVHEARTYWKNYLEGYERPVSIPAFEKPKPYSHATHTFHVPPYLVEKMESISREKKLTVNTLFQSAWGILLQKYNHARDAVFGTVVSGRPPELLGVESIVGLFINTRPQRIRTEEGDSFATICSKVQTASYESTPFEYYPLYEIQTNCELKNRLFDHVIAFENYPLIDQLRDMGGETEQSLCFEEVQVFERANYDFSIIVNPRDLFSVKFIYNEGRYSRETMEGLERSLKNLLEAACFNPDIPIDHLSLCSNQDQSFIIQKSIGKQPDYPSETTVDTYFKKRASEFPEDTALIWRDRQLTYSELDVWSDRLAAQMRAKGLKPGVNVGLLIGRCPEMVAGMLAIMKTGATYIPLDMNSPVERLALLVEETDIEIICTQRDLAARLPDEVETILLDDTDHIFDEDQQVVSDHHADSPAYIMYTSGSTGKPKGCMITHRNILRLVFASDFMEFGHGQVMLQTCSPSFDPSVFEIWVALLHGGTLVVADEEDVIDAERFSKLLIDRNVSSTQLVTALFNRLCDQDPQIFAPLKSMMVGGDILSAKYVHKVKEFNPQLKLINGYGPTENTVISAIHEVGDLDLDLERIPIGRPLDHSSVYVLDAGLNPLPVGAVGELCVGGDGVGLGYYKRPELTNQLFVQDPFIPGRLLYRTGDLARWLPNGTVDFLGRADSQVKFRGYRIEIGEIERVLAELSNVKEVVVQVQEVAQEKQLCAYYTADHKPNIDEWRQRVASKLPEYMIPMYFIQLEDLPLTTNFKIDKAALPKPTSMVPSSPSRFRPKSAIETVVFDIISEVLGVEEGIPLNYNFFELGVNSLNIITINNRLKEKLNRDIPLTVMFQYTSIARLAEYLQAEEESASSAKNDEDEMDGARGTLLKTNRLIKLMEGKQ